MAAVDSLCARLIRPGDGAWAAVLDRTSHDIYQLPGYAQVEAARMGGEACALLLCADHEFVLQPLVLRPIPGDDARDAISPYGYAGPLISAGWDDAALDQALDAALSTLADAGVCSAFIRLDPLCDYPLQVLARHGEVVTQGQTVWCDLTQSDDDLNAAMSPQTRSRLRRAERDDLSAAIDDWVSFPDFRGLYASTMDRVDAADWYKFDDDYFEGLRGALGEALHLCTVRAADHTVLAAGLFTSECDTVQYHLAGRAPDGGPAAVRLMLATMRTWAKTSGYQRLHLGGGVGGEQDSLFDFKAGFASNRAELRAWTVISDEAAYSRLSADVDDAAGFFPAYRASR